MIELKTTLESLTEDLSCITGDFMDLWEDARAAHALLAKCQRLEAALEEIENHNGKAFNYDEVLKRFIRQEKPQETARKALHPEREASDE